MKRFFPLLLLILLAGCGLIPPETKKPVTSTLFAMDTVMDLTVYGDESVLTAAAQMINHMESAVSVTREDSEIYAINQSGSGTVSPVTGALLSRALELCTRTEGNLDITLYPVLRAWGFTTGAYHVPSDTELQPLLSHVDYSAVRYDSATETVSLPPEAQIDLGSLTKGYLSDCLIALFRENGVSSGLVNLGGNVHALGTKPDGSLWRVAVQNPQNDDYLGTLSIANQAVITSGGYERYFTENGHTYWHILNPATGHPAENGLISVTIVGEEGITCDGLSTALFVMGLDRATQFWRSSDDFEAIFVTTDGLVTITEGLQDVFSLSPDYPHQEVTVISRD